MKKGDFDTFIWNGRWNEKFYFIIFVKPTTKLLIDSLSFSIILTIQNWKLEIRKSVRLASLNVKGQCSRKSLVFFFYFSFVKLIKFGFEFIFKFGSVSIRVLECWIGSVYSLHNHEWSKWLQAENIIHSNRFLNLMRYEAQNLMYCNSLAICSI